MGFGSPMFESFGLGNMGSGHSSVKCGSQHLPAFVESLDAVCLKKQRPAVQWGTYTFMELQAHEERH